jgi:hypothetical protein
MCGTWRVRGQDGGCELLNEAVVVKKKRSIFVKRALNILRPFPVTSYKITLCCAQPSPPKWRVSAVMYSETISRYVVKVIKVLDSAR